MVSVKRGFLFLLVLGIGCAILLCHSLGFPHIIILNFIEMVGILMLGFLVRVLGMSFNSGRMVNSHIGDFRIYP